MIKRLRHPLVQIVFSAVVLALIGRYLAAQWSQIRSEPFSINPILLVLAQLGYVVGLLMLPMGGWLVARELDAHVSKVGMWHSFALGMVAKYLPGSVWSLPSRAVLYKGLGITHSLQVVYWETGLMVVAATCVAVSALPMLSQFDVFVPIVLLLGGGSAAFLGGSWLLQRDWLASRLPKIELNLALPTILTVLLGYALAWGVLGFSFMLTVRAAGGTWNAYSVGLFAGGWAVGFLSILTPGGIGVRDGILIAGVGIFASEPIPLVAAVLARICWTVAELVTLSFVHYNYQRETHYSDSLLE